MHLPNPEFRRVITFPDIALEAPQAQAQAQNHRVKLYPTIILSLASGIVIGLVMACSALWLDPDQHNLRALQDRVNNAEKRIDTVKQCIGDL